jgi:hypothetical protein
MKMLDIPVPEVRFGFCGSDDRVVSLNVPAINANGKCHPFCSFDIEHDPDRPNMLTITLFEADQDNFIHTVIKSISFPARTLAELLSRREASKEEIAAWQSPSTDDDW